MSINAEKKKRKRRHIAVEKHIEARSSETELIAELNEWATIVHKRHVMLGGDPLTNCEEITDACDYSHCNCRYQIIFPTESAFERLETYGRAYKSNDKWVLRRKNFQVLGKGEATVYLYYFPNYRGTAELQGKSVWACKLGMTTEPDVRKYIRSQLTRAHPEDFHLTLELKTNNHITLENQIKGILKVLGRHKKDTPKGTEWFVTNAHEVITIYDFIHHFGEETMTIGKYDLVERDAYEQS